MWLNPKLRAAVENTEAIFSILIWEFVWFSKFKEFKNVHIVGILYIYSGVFDSACLNMTGFWAMSLSDECARGR